MSTHEEGSTKERMQRVTTKWLAELFEFENCEECGGDEHDHVAVGVLGNFFALCKESLKEKEDSHDL